MTLTVRTRVRRSGLVMLFAILAAPCAVGAAPNFNLPATHASVNLEFRVAAFDLYQQRYFSSINQLLTVIHQPGVAFGRSDNKAFLADYLYHPRDLSSISQTLIAGRLSDALLSKDETDVVAADLYLALGLTKPAEQLLRGVTGKHTAAPLHSWLNMSRSFYQRGYLTEAEQALANLGDLPQGKLRAERSSLSALLLMARNRNDEAIAALKTVNDAGDRPALDLYNLGIALLNKGDTEEGETIIGRLSEAAKASPDAAPLSDLADVSLGYTLLAQKRLEQAGSVLQEAASINPLSNYALLGAGWSDLLQGDARKALTSWLPLIERDPRDEAVQEGLLAVPYAYYRLQDYTQASNLYQQAAKRYQQELENLHAARAPLTDGTFLNSLLTMNPANKEFDWQWRLEKLPALPAISYLLPTLASHRFQEGLKNYRDLHIAQDILTDFRYDIDASLSLLTKQREIHARWERHKQAGDKGLSPAALSARIKGVQNDLASVEAHPDVMALATAKQKRMLLDLKEANTLLAKLKSVIVDNNALQAKYQLLQGLLIWDLTEQYQDRIKEVRQQLQEVERALSMATNNQPMLLSSSEQVNAALTEQENKYKALRARQTQLLEAIKPLLADQRKQLELQLVDALADGEKRVARYLPQARLGIAQTIDQLAGSDPKKDYSQAIANYQAYLDSSGESPYRRDIMYRTAYLKMLQAENREQGTATAKGNSGGNDAVYNEVITMLGQLLSAYPNRPDNDRILYNLAKAYDHRGATDGLLDTLDTLAKNYPRSAYIDEVQFRRGELLFSLGLGTQAAEAYTAIVAKGPDSPLYEKALYKLGWSRYKEGRYDAAVDTFLPLLERKLKTAAKGNKPAGASPTRSEEELANDIERGAVLCLAQLNGVQSLANYYAQHGAQPYEDRLYETLARLYIEQQRIEDAANVYRTFVARHPNHPQAPLFESKVLTAYEKGGFIDLLERAKEDFANRYEPAGAYWKSNPDAARGDILNKVRGYLQELTRYTHAKAQKSKTPADYQSAEHWYRLFLQSFPQDPLAPEMHFLLAETLFEEQHYAAAIPEYEKVAYEYKDAQRGAEAAYAALLAHEKAAIGLGGADQQAAAQQSLSAMQRFADAYPNDPRTPAVLGKIAQEWFSRHDRPRAEQAAQRVLDLKPEATKDLRLSAWIILGHSQFEDQHYADAEHSYQQTLKLMSGSDAQRHDIVENLAASVYKQGELARAGGDQRGAAQHFLRIADLAPEAGIVATAQYDAAAALLTAEDWPAAIRILTNFRAHYPSHALQKEVAPKLALAYQKSGEWRKAAVELETIASQSEEAALQRDATWQSADLYLRAGQTPEALRVYQDYVRRFPKPAAEAIEAQQRLAELYAQQKNTEQYHLWLQQIIDTDKRSGGERNDRTRLLAGRAALVLADTHYPAFAEIKLTHPLKKSLQLKKKAMEDALTAYRAAGDYGIAEITTAATYHAAQIYGELGKAIMDSERPKDLNALELEQYNVLLEEQAFPFEEQAIALYEADAKRTTENIYDDWVKKSFAALRKLMPGRYAKNEKGEAYVDTLY